MKKLLEFGRKAMFLIRVLSGYEERRIRSYRLHLQNRLQQAEAKKAALRRVPEQAILSEVRQMVEQMQALNTKLEETEAAIDEYFKPLNKEAQMIMNLRLEDEKKTMKDMMRVLQEEATMEKIVAEKSLKVNNVEHNNKGEDTSESTPTT